MADDMKGSKDAVHDDDSDIGEWRRIGSLLTSDKIRRIDEIGVVFEGNVSNISASSGDVENKSERSSFDVVGDFNNEKEGVKIGIKSWAIQSLYHESKSYLFSVSSLSFNRMLKLSLISQQDGSLFTSIFDNKEIKKVIEASAVMVICNPEAYTAWNRRREVFNALKLSKNEKDYLEFFHRELLLIHLILKYIPKSQTTWQYRKWIVDSAIKHGSKLSNLDTFLENEINICRESVKKYSRLYYAWNYRQYVSDLLSTKMIKVEIEDIRSYVKQVTNDFSALSYYQHLLQLLLERDHQLILSIRQRASFVYQELAYCADWLEIAKEIHPNTEPQSLLYHFQFILVQLWLKQVFYGLVIEEDCLSEGKKAWSMNLSDGSSPVSKAIDCALASCDADPESVNDPRLRQQSKTFHTNMNSVDAFQVILDELSKASSLLPMKNSFAFSSLTHLLIFLSVETTTATNSEIRGDDRLTAQSLTHRAFNILKEELDMRRQRYCTSCNQ